MNKKLLLLLTLFMFILPVKAQDKYTISGKIVDANTGETILGATVSLEGTTMGVTTNEYGFYSITAVEGEYKLVVSYLGYDVVKQSVSLKLNQRIDIEMQEKTNMLDEVTISAERSSSQNIGKPQVGVAAMNIETVKQVPVVLGEVDVMKTLGLLPGVSGNGEGVGGLHVRGGAEDQNLILLDEAIIYNTSHLFGFFSVFNSDAIKDLKLYRGGIPAKFGGRVSSVLDVRQKDGNNKKLAITGGLGLLSSRLAVEGPWLKDKGSFLIAGRGSYAHLLLKLRNQLKKEEEEEGKSSDDNSAYFYDLNLKGGYQFNENNRFFLSAYTGRDVFDLNKIFKNSYGNNTANLRWNHIFSDKTFSNLSLIYSKYDYDLELVPIGLKWQSDIQNFNVKYDLAYYANDKFKLEAGLSAISYDFNAGEVKPSTKTSAINYEKLDPKQAEEYALYLGAEQKIGEKISFHYGLRLSDFRRVGKQTLNQYKDNRPLVFNEKLGIYEDGVIVGKNEYKKNKTIKNFFNWEPRLVFSYQWNENNALKAGFSRTAQYIHLISNTAMATPLDIWTPSGPYVKPQLANQYSLGYATQFAEDVFSLEVETYYKTVKNRIDYINGASLVAQNTIETEILAGESRAYGLEVLVKKEVGNTTGWLSYTLSNSEQRTLGGNAGGLGINGGNWYKTPYDRTHDVSLTLAHKLSERWKLGANFIFKTGAPVTYPNGRYDYQGLLITSYAERNANRLPSYHRLDISATYSPGNNKNRRWKSEWVFGVYNLYNRKNAASIAFGQNPDTGVNEATRTAIFGLVPSVTYNFKF